MKYLRRYNESVRDMLKPKTEEDIKKSMGKKKYHIYKSLSDAKDSIKPPFETTELIFKEISGKLASYFGVNLRFLPYSVSYDGELWTVSYAYNRNMINGHYNTWDETWDGILEFTDQSLTEEISTIQKEINRHQGNVDELKELLSKILLDNKSMNESVRDMLKPKSKEDIKKLMDKYINVYPKLGTFDPGSFGLTMDVKQSTPTVGDFILVDEKNNHWHMTLSDWNGKYSIRLAAHAPNFLIFRREFFKFNSFDELENYLISIGYKKMNESVRGMMKPKSEEEIKRNVKNLPPREKLTKGSREGILWLVKDAMEHGANVKWWKNEALTDASSFGHLDIIEYLLDNGTDIHFNENSALRYACREGMVDVVELLLSRGADVKAKEYQALEWALFYQHNDVVDILNEYIAKVFNNDN